MEPKSAYSEGHHGLQETHFYRAKKFEDIKDYMAALPKVASSNYMMRASLGQTFGPPNKKKFKDLTDRLQENLLDYSSNSKQMYEKNISSAVTYSTDLNDSISYKQPSIYQSNKSCYK